MNSMPLDALLLAILALVALVVILQGVFFSVRWWSTLLSSNRRSSLWNNHLNGWNER